MAKPERKRFKFTASGDLKANVANDDVLALQSILGRFGYLRGSYKPGSFCGCTERAVRRYQRYYGLKADGIVGPKTKAMLERPRCGVPDLPGNLTGASPDARFVLRGCKYNTNHLTYAFVNGTADLAGGREQAIVREAFDAWSNVADLTFEEVGVNQNPHFRIAWRTGDHGDGDSFDGPGSTLAHAFFPPPCGGPNAGDLHFDEGEQWIDDPGANGILLRQVAIHEIGHLLGLSHSEDEDAIMFAYYAPDRIHLAADDIAGIVELYGEPTDSRGLQLSAEASGALAQGGDEARFEVKVPTSVEISIDGPGDADFDLYVKRGEPPTTSDWEYRAYTVSSDEKIMLPVVAGENYHIMVRSYSGGGEFKVRVEPSGS
jgi:hypothetical protein